MHKRFLLLIFTLFLSVPLFAQLEVKEGSFKEVEGFVNINMDKMYDDNDQPYSVIKVRTENINDKQRRDLLFEGDARTFIEYEYKVGEVWLYISYYATYLKISHPEYSSIEFHLPFDLQPKKGYELTLVNMTNYTPIPEKPKLNYLIVKSDQPDAMIFIDSVYVGNGEGTRYFNVGERHTWKIECDMYYPESGDTVILAEKKIHIDKKLRPAFGYLNVTSKPEDGAVVSIDDKKVGQTPYKSDRLASGEHKVRVMKEMFYAAEDTFMVTDGNTIQASLTMRANFASVTVTTDSESDIYVDNEKKGKGTWKGKLSAREHTFEAKKDLHKTTIKIDTLDLGNYKHIEIPNPEPIYGELYIKSDPNDAIIYIDGKKKGKTPTAISDILIGQHELRLEKNGYITQKKSFILNENKPLNLNEKLDVNPQNTPQPKADKETEKVVNQKDGTKHKQRRNYKGPIMGVDKIRINGMSLGTEIVWCNEYYWKSCFMLSWSLGITVFPDRSAIENVGLSVGWQLNKGTGLHFTPQIELKASTFDELVICPKIKIAYPLTNRFVIGITPMIGIGVFEFEEIFGGISLNLGWQKIRNK